MPILTSNAFLTLPKPLKLHVLIHAPRQPVQQPGDCPADHRSMEDRLQHRTPAHEPGRAHPRGFCNPPQAGAHGGRTLLINEGTFGAGSRLHILPPWRRAALRAPCSDWCSRPCRQAGVLEWFTQARAMPPDIQSLTSLMGGLP